MRDVFDGGTWDMCGGVVGTVKSGYVGERFIDQCTLR